MIYWGDAETLQLFVQEEDKRRAKEEQERQEEEEYLRLKASFIIEEQGEEEQLTEAEVCCTPIRSLFRFLQKHNMFVFFPHSQETFYKSSSITLRWELRVQKNVLKCLLTVC